MLSQFKINNMTKEEILHIAKVIQFPHLEGKFNNYGGNIIRMPVTRDDQYTTWAKNNHHVKTLVHFHKVMPVLSELLDIPFTEDDFQLQHNTSEGYDITMPYPIQSQLYTIQSLSRDEQFANVPYEEFFISNTRDEYACTAYHHLYKYAHESSTVDNHTNQNGRRLFVLGDSHMIPLIPMLSIYFQHITYVDNRKKCQILSKIDKISYTDAIIELSTQDLSEVLKGLI